MLVSGTKKLFLKWIRTALRQQRMEVRDCNGPLNWKLDLSFFQVDQNGQEETLLETIEETSAIQAEAAQSCESA